MEDERNIKKDIVFDYCGSHPTTALAVINGEIGVEVAIQMMNLFQGKMISFPTRNSLRRSVIPMTITRNLLVLKKDSNEFKIVVKQLSKAYGLPKRAIIQMNESGEYTR